MSLSFNPHTALLDVHFPHLADEETEDKVHINTEGHSSQHTLILSPSNLGLLHIPHSTRPQ